MLGEWAAALGVEAGLHPWPWDAFVGLLAAALGVGMYGLLRHRGRGAPEPGLAGALLAARAVPALLLDAAGRVLHLNPAAQDLLGMRPEQVLGVPAGELLGMPGMTAPAQPGAEAPSAELHLRDGRVLSAQLDWLPWPGGAPAGEHPDARWVLLLKVLPPSAGGESVWAGSIMDAVPQQVWIKDLRLRYVRVNQAQARACGSTPEAFVGHTAQELAAALVLDALDYPELDRQVLETGTARDLLPKLVRGPSGQERYFRVQRLPVRDGQGRLAGVMGVAGDVTPLIEAERGQRAQHRLLQEVLNGVPHRIVVKDRSGRCLLANHAAEAECARAGLPSPVGQSAEDSPALLPGKPQLALETDRRVLEHGETVDLPDVLLPGTDGQPTYHHLLKIPVRDEAGQVTGLIGIAMDITARWQAEQELDRLVALSPDMQGMATLQGHLLRANPAFARCLGYSAQELLAAPAQDLVHPEDLDQARAALQRLGESAALASAVLRMRHRDGSYRSVAWRAKLDREAGRVYFVGRDVTEQLGAERALLESEARFRAVIEALAEGVVVQDAQRQIVTCNPSAMRILGIGQERLGGRLRLPPGWSFLDVDGQPLQEADFPAARALRSGQPQPGTLIQARRPDGQALWLSVSAQPLLNAGGGKPYAIVTSFVDLTQQKRAEQRLAESDRRFRALVAHAPVAIFQSDAHGNAVLVNKRWCELTGMTQADAMGAGWVRAVHPEDRERLMARRKQLLETGNGYAIEYRYVKPDGQVVWGIGASTPLRDEQGAITGLLGTFTDLSERKRAEQRLAESDR
ncbi:MAG TPA: PAS domain S-box protein, partial [bacterium]|nr:PAS domain S-box protein [bacterium]